MRHIEKMPPPAGWFTLGSHNDYEGELEFWGEELSEDGLPIWERPAPQYDYRVDGDWYVYESLERLRQDYAHPKKILRRAKAGDWEDTPT